MAEFKIGDKVVRHDVFQAGEWSLFCARTGHADNAVFSVIQGNDSFIQVAPDGFWWDSSCFRTATGLEEHQGASLSAEDRLRESDAHIECLRELLDIAWRKVDELQAEVARCCGTVADKTAMEEQIAELEELLDVRNEQLTTQALRNNRQSAEMDDLVEQRDAAVTAAKSLGEEVQALRQDRRSLRLGFHSLDGLFGALNAGLADIDFGLLRSQLNLISDMAAEQGNGADAKLCADAYQVVDFVDRALADWRVGRDE